MQLTHDFTAVPEAVWKNPDGTTKNRALSLAKAMPFIGLNEIKDSNAIEFFLRLRLFESIFGSILTTEDGAPLYAGLDDVLLHVGTKTKEVANVTTMDYWREHCRMIAVSLDQKMPEQVDESRIILPH